MSIPAPPPVQHKRPYDQGPGADPSSNLDHHSAKFPRLDNSHTPIPSNSNSTTNTSPMNYVPAPYIKSSQDGSISSQHYYPSPYRSASTPAPSSVTSSSSSPSASSTPGLASSQPRTLASLPPPASPHLVVTNTSIRLDYSDDPFFEFPDDKVPLQFMIDERNQRYNRKLIVTEIMMSQLRDNKHKLLMRCFNMARSGPNQPPASHTWPSGFSLFVNGMPIDVSKRDEKKKTLNLPADLTPHVRAGVNDLVVTAATNLSHYVVVQVARCVSVERLVKAIPQTEEEVGRKRIMDSFGRGDGVERCKVSLLDPLVRTRIVIPVRGRLCGHLQCFDLTNYLLMNERIRRWQCPCCSTNVPYTDLYIDSFFTSVIQGMTEDEVVFDKSGTWHRPSEILPPPKPSSHSQPKGNVTPQWTPKRGGGSTIVVLDDDDDDINPAEDEVSSLLSSLVSLRLPRFNLSLLVDFSAASRLKRQPEYQQPERNPA